MPKSERYAIGHGELALSILRALHIDPSYVRAIRINICAGEVVTVDIERFCLQGEIRDLCSVLDAQARADELIPRMDAVAMDRCKATTETYAQAARFGGYPTPREDT